MDPLQDVPPVAVNRRVGLWSVTVVLGFVSRTGRF